MRDGMRGVVFVVVGLVFGLGCEATPPPAPAVKSDEAEEARAVCQQMHGQAQLCCPAGQASRMPQPLVVDARRGVEVQPWCGEGSGGRFPYIQWRDGVIVDCGEAGKLERSQWRDEGLSGVAYRCVGDGGPEGPFVRFYETGERFQVGRYAAGVLSGSMTQWFIEGPKEAEGTYAADVRHGLWVFWDKEGNRIREDDWEKGQRHGWARAFWNNGLPRLEVAMVEGKMHGPYRVWWYNGQLREEGEKVENASVGLYRYFWESGAPYAEGVRSGADACGAWSCWTQSGEAAPCFSGEERADHFAKCKANASGAQCPKCL